MLNVLRLIESEGARIGPPSPDLPFAWQRERLDSASLFANEGGPVMASTSDAWVPARGRRVQCRVYHPSERQAGPALIFFHGGGWVRSSIETHDRLARELAAAAGAIIVSVDYALAPEAIFPHAVEECADVTAWIAEYGATWGLDPTQLAVCGDSAGANLAFATALFLRDRGQVFLKAIFAAYPVCDFDFSTPSYLEFADGCFLTRDLMRGFWNAYAPGQALRMHPYAAPLRAQLAGLPPTLIQLAEMDVLHSEGAAMAARLTAADVDVTCETFAGMAHGFLRHTGRIAKARIAMDKAGAWLAAH